MIRPCDPLDQKTYDSLDRGVRELVAYLRTQGFETTDSGDGSKELSPDNLPWPHVAMILARENMVEEAIRLRHLVERVFKLDEIPQGVITLSYDPATPDFALLLIEDAHEDSEDAFMLHFKTPEPAVVFQ